MWGVFKVMELTKLKTKVADIVSINLRKYLGGEIYFDNLDEQIKNNPSLICTYLEYIVRKEGNNNIIVSGEIGNKLIEYQKDGKLSKHINLFVLPGGLRKGILLKNTINIQNNKFIFFDDSYYSGKTLQTIINHLKKYNATIEVSYVVYDGSKHNIHNTHSLYRYYDMKGCG